MAAYNPHNNTSLPFELVPHQGALFAAVDAHHVGGEQFLRVALEPGADWPPLVYMEFLKDDTALDGVYWEWAAGTPLVVDAFCDFRLQLVRWTSFVQGGAPARSRFCSGFDYGRCFPREMGQKCLDGGRRAHENHRRGRSGSDV